jgi:hypothetical protein
VIVDILGNSECPSGVLKYDTISVAVFESDAFLVPVGIEGRNWRIAVSSHARDGGIPIGAIGKVENQKVVLGRSSAAIVPACASELEVISFRRPT